MESKNDGGLQCRCISNEVCRTCRTCNACIICISCVICIACTHGMRNEKHFGSGSFTGSLNARAFSWEGSEIPLPFASRRVKKKMSSPITDE